MNTEIQKNTDIMNTEYRTNTEKYKYYEYRMQNEYRNSYLLIQLTAIAVKQTACDSTPLSAA
jgi:hypothetical protein